MRYVSPMTGVPIDLASLVEPRSESEFIDSFLRKERFIVKTSHGERAEAILPEWTLDRLVASNILPSRRFDGRSARRRRR